MLGNSIIWIVIAARVSAAVYIYFNPLWGFILTLLFDLSDSMLVTRTVKPDRMSYNKLDKSLDWVGYFFMLLTGIKFGIFWPLFLLLAFRLAGQILFVRTKSERFFILFPSFFEATFVWLVLMDGKNLIWLIILLAIKESQEISLHYFFPLYLKKNGGYPKLVKKLGWDSYDTTYDP